jgi:hypothetical protein
MIYQLTEFFRMVQAHHRLPLGRREPDLLGRLSSLHRTPACLMPDDSRRALGLFLARRVAR